MAKSPELKLVMLLSIVVGICLVGTLGLSAQPYVGNYGILGDTGVRIIVNVLFWGALVLCVLAKFLRRESRS